MSFDRLDPFGASAARRVVVVGHPGHELAIFGLLQGHRPDAIVVITDGGPPERAAQSREGLASIGLLARTRFLDYPERGFYDALLNADVTLLSEAIRDLRNVFSEFGPTQVFCDAIEFYNPIHDITLPLVRAALAGADTTIYELPLVYEVPGTSEAYRIQRVPDLLAHRRVVYELSLTELNAKTRARDHIYRSLHAQAGPELLSVSREDMRREEVFVSAAEVCAPGTWGRALRYERRARLLHEDGRISRMITYSEHVAPMLDALGVARSRT